MARHFGRVQSNHVGQISCKSLGLSELLIAVEDCKRGRVGLGAVGGVEPVAVEDTEQRLIVDDRSTEEVRRKHPETGAGEFGEVVHQKRSPEVAEAPREHHSGQSQHVLRAGEVLVDNRVAHFGDEVDDVGIEVNFLQNKLEREGEFGLLVHVDDLVESAHNEQPQISEIGIADQRL